MSSRRGSYRSGADKLAASPPEVSWQGRRVRLYLPAARLYGNHHGGAVVLLTPETARGLVAAISATLADAPAPAASRARSRRPSSPRRVERDVPEVLRGVTR